MSGHEQALSAAAEALKNLKPRRPTFIEQAQAAVSVYLTAHKGEYGELEAEARRTGSSEGWKYWDGHIPKLFTDLADAIGVLMAKLVHRQMTISPEEAFTKDYYRARAKAAEAREGEANSLCEALYDEVKSHFGGHVPFTTTMAEVKNWLGGSDSKRDHLQARVTALEGEIKRSANVLEIYTRVHAEIEGGKEWPEIDNGLRGENHTYEGWLAFMQQSLINGLRSIHLATVLATPDESGGGNA